MQNRGAIFKTNNITCLSDMPLAEAMHHIMFQTILVSCCAIRSVIEVTGQRHSQALLSFKQDTEGHTVVVDGWQQHPLSPLSLEDGLALEHAGEDVAHHNL